MTVDFSTLGLPEFARPLARLISDYDEQLSLIRLPDQSEWLIENPDKPYALVHGTLGGSGYIIESFPESMLDDRIMRIVLEGDARKHGWDLSKVHPEFVAASLLTQKKRQDEIDLLNDKWAFSRKGRTHF